MAARSPSVTGRIGMLGMPNCGKTAYLHALELSSPQLPSWRLREMPSRPGRTGLGDYVAERSREGEQWSNTELGEVREFAMFEAHRRGLPLLGSLFGRARIDVTVFDPPGEIVKILSGETFAENDAVRAHVEAYRAALTTCNGVLCLIDASLDETQFARDVQRLSNVLGKLIADRSANRPPLYVSWILTKADDDALRPLGRERFAVTASTSRLLRRAERYGIDPGRLGVRTEHGIAELPVTRALASSGDDLDLAAGVAWDFVSAVFPRAGLGERIHLLGQDGRAHSDLFLVSSWGRELAPGKVPERNEIRPLRLTDPLRNLLGQIDLDRRARSSVSLASRVAVFSGLTLAAVAVPAAWHRDGLRTALVSNAGAAAASDALEAALRRDAEGLLGAHRHLWSIRDLLGEAVARLDDRSLDDDAFAARWQATAWLTRNDLRDAADFAPLRHAARDAWLRRFEDRPDGRGRLLEMADGRLVCDAAVHAVLLEALQGEAWQVTPADAGWPALLTPTPGPFLTPDDDAERRAAQLRTGALQLDAETGNAWQQSRGDHLQRIATRLAEVDAGLDRIETSPPGVVDAEAEAAVTTALRILTSPDGRACYTPEVHARLLALQRSVEDVDFAAGEVVNEHASRLLERLNANDPVRFPFEISLGNRVLGELVGALSAADDLASLARAIERAVDSLRDDPELRSIGDARLRAYARNRLRAVLRSDAGGLGELADPAAGATRTAWQARLRSWPLDPSAATPGSGQTTSEPAATDLARPIGTDRPDAAWFDALLLLLDHLTGSDVDAAELQAAFADWDRTRAALAAHDPQPPAWLRLRELTADRSAVQRRVDGELAAQFGAPATRPTSATEGVWPAWFALLLATEHGPVMLADLVPTPGTPSEAIFHGLLLPALEGATVGPALADPRVRSMLVTAIDAWFANDFEYPAEALYRLAKTADDEVLDAWLAHELARTLRTPTDDHAGRVFALATGAARLDDPARARPLLREALDDPASPASLPLWLAWLAEHPECPQALRAEVRGLGIERLQSSRDELPQLPAWPAYLSDRFALPPAMPRATDSLAHSAAVWLLDGELRLDAAGTAQLGQRLRDADTTELQARCRQQLEARRDDPQLARDLITTGAPGDPLPELELLRELTPGTVRAVEDHWQRLRERGAELAVLTLTDGITLLSRREFTVGEYRRLCRTNDLAFRSSSSLGLQIDADQCTGNWRPYDDLNKPRDPGRRDPLPISGLPFANARDAARAVGGRLPTVAEYSAAIADLDLDAVRTAAKDGSGKIDEDAWVQLTPPWQGRDVSGEQRIVALFHGVSEWVETPGGDAALVGCSWSRSTEELFETPPDRPRAPRFDSPTDAGFRVAFDLLPALD